MLAQDAQAAPLATLVFLLGGLLIAVVVVLTLLRLFRRRLLTPHHPPTPPAPVPDAWEESARRLATPTEDP